VANRALNRRQERFRAARHHIKSKQAPHQNEFPITIKQQPDTISLGNQFRSSFAERRAFNGFNRAKCTNTYTAAVAKAHLCVRSNKNRAAIESFAGLRGERTHIIEEDENRDDNNSTCLFLEKMSIFSCFF